jgi:hypothetical protein
MTAHNVTVMFTEVHILQIRNEIWNAAQGCDWHFVTSNRHQLNTWTNLANLRICSCTKVHTRRVVVSLYPIYGQ